MTADIPVNGRDGGLTRVLLASPLEVLRDACARGSTGQLVFYTAAGVARVWLRGGVVVDACLGRSEGERALLQVLCYDSSRWREVAGAGTERQTLHASLGEIEEKVAARRRQWTELLACLPPLSAVLHPHPARPPAAGEDAPLRSPQGGAPGDPASGRGDREDPGPAPSVEPGLGEVRSAVYALVDGRTPLFAVIDRSGLDPVAALCGVSQLLDAGVVSWPEAPASVGVAPLDDPFGSELGSGLEVLEELAPSAPVRLLGHRSVRDVAPSEPTAAERPSWTQRSSPAEGSPTPGEISAPPQEDTETREPPASSKPRPVVGRYEILGRLGQGGMATVYSCRLRGEGGFSRRFAMKVLREHLCRSPEAVQALLREARLTGRLHHPNVVSVVDVGSDRGQPYLVMEYVAGCSVAELLAAESRGGLLVASPVAAAIAIEALAGLHAAHTLGDERGRLLGLVHQDVSPENLLVGFDGVTRVTDFGVAHVSDVMASRGQEHGKPQYLAPERITTGEVDHRADIFALGVVLYRLLTGLHLFDGEEPAEVMQRVLYEPIPPPSTVGRQPHPAFDPVCLRALERDRDRRYQSAEHFRADLLRTAVLVDQLALPSEIAELARRAADPGDVPSSGGELRLPDEEHSRQREPALSDLEGLPHAGVRAIVLARPPRTRVAQRPARQETQVLPSARHSKPLPTWVVAVFLVLSLGLALALDAFSDSAPEPLPVPEGAPEEPADDALDTPEVRIRLDDDDDLFAPLRDGLEPAPELEEPGLEPEGRPEPPAVPPTATPPESTD